MLRHFTFGYFLTSPLASSRNSAGGIPSRERKPCSARDRILRGWPASMRQTRRQQRPRISAALRPAGPPPMMRTSNASAVSSFMHPPASSDLFGSFGVAVSAYTFRQIARQTGTELRLMPAGDHRLDASRPEIDGASFVFLQFVCDLCRIVSF